MRNTVVHLLNEIHVVGVLGCLDTVMQSVSVLVVLVFVLDFWLFVVVHDWSVDFCGSDLDVVTAFFGCFLFYHLSVHPLDRFLRLPSLLLNVNNFRLHELPLVVRLVILKVPLVRRILLLFGHSADRWDVISILLKLLLVLDGLEPSFWAWWVLFLVLDLWKKDPV